MSKKNNPINFQNYQEVEIKNIIKAEWNYKEDDHEKAEKLLNNIQENGQLENIIVRELGDGRLECVNGNHRLDVFKELGYEKVIVCNLGSISLKKAQKIAIQTNETKFENNSLKLAETISNITEEFSIEEMVSTMPYTQEDIDNFRSIADFDFNDYAGNVPASVETQSEDKPTPPKSALPEEVDPIKTVVLRIEESVYLLWKEWVAKVNERLGYDSDNKAFEIAIVEALNLPEDHLN